MTLTELSVYTRKVVPLLIIGSLSVLIIYFSLKIALRPSDPGQIQENPYDIVFGKIPPVSAKEATPSSAFNFTFDTIEGVPVSTTDRARVYFIPENNRQIGFSLKTNVMAETLGFSVASTPGRVEFPTITYEDAKQKLVVDITRYNYEYQYALGDDDEFLSNLTPVPAVSTITDQATEFLTKVGRYPDELARGKPNIIYLNFDPVEKRINVSQSPDQANMVEVDFYRGDIDEFPSVTGSYFNSQNYVLMLYHSKGMKVVRAQVKFFESSEDQVGVYPLKSAETAWQQVLDGKGIVAYAEPDITNVIIKEMFLAYFDPPEYLEYLQPVYVFLGGKESNFAVYVPAVDDSQLATGEAEMSAGQ